MEIFGIRQKLSMKHETHILSRSLREVEFAEIKSSPFADKWYVKRKRMTSCEEKHS